MSVTVTGLGEVTTVHLAAYDRVLRAWTMRAGPLAVSDGAMTTTLPGAGSYALVRPDDSESQGVHIGLYLRVVKISDCGLRIEKLTLI